MIDACFKAQECNQNASEECHPQIKLKLPILFPERKSNLRVLINTVWQGLAFALLLPNLQNACIHVDAPLNLVTIDVINVHVIATHLESDGLVVLLRHSDIL